MIRTVPKTVEEEVAACNLCGVIWKLGLEQTLKEACQGTKRNRGSDYPRLGQAQGKAVING